MGKKTSYIVLRFDEKFIVLSPHGSVSRRLGANEAEMMLARSSIISVAKRGAVLDVTTSGGQAIEVFFGMRRAQAALTRSAFGMPQR